MVGKYTATIGGASQGAKMGAMFGPWGMAIGGVLGGLFGNSQAKKEAKALKEMYQAQLKAIQKANDANLAEQRRVTNEINRQRTTATIATSQALFHYDRQATGQQGNVKQQIAAADQKGSAAIMLEAEIIRAEEEAKAVALRNLETNQENLNANVASLANQTLASRHDAGHLAGMFQSMEESPSDIFGALGGMMQGVQGFGGFESMGKQMSSTFKTNDFTSADLKTFNKSPWDYKDPVVSMRATAGKSRGLFG